MRATRVLHEFSLTKLLMFAHLASQASLAIPSTMQLASLLGSYINGRIDKRLLVVLTVFPCLSLARGGQEAGAKPSHYRVSCVNISPGRS